jgi:hypothetical protein
VTATDSAHEAGRPDAAQGRGAGAAREHRLAAGERHPVGFTSLVTSAAAPISATPLTQSP